MKEAKLINNKVAKPTPKIHHLCADLLRLSKPNIGSCEPKVAKISIMPISKRRFSAEKK